MTAKNPAPHDLRRGVAQAERSARRRALRLMSSASASMYCSPSRSNRSVNSARNTVWTVTPWSGRSVTVIESPARTCPGVIARNVTAGEGRRGERLDEAGDLEPRGERLAGRARRGELQHEAVGSDPPAFADDRGGDVHTRRGEVLAEHAVADLAVQPAGPVIEVLAGVRVHRLVASAVQLPVAEFVAGQAAARAGAR